MMGQLRLLGNSTYHCRDHKVSHAYMAVHKRDIDGGVAQRIALNSGRGGKGVWVCPSPVREWNMLSQ